MRTSFPVSKKAFPMAQRRSGVLLRRSFLIAVCFAWFGLGGGQQPVKAQCPEQIYSFTVGAYLGDGVPALSSKITVGGARTVFAVGFPRLGGMIERAELEIVTSAIYARSHAPHFRGNSMTGTFPDGSARPITVRVLPRNTRESTAW